MHAVSKGLGAAALTGFLAAAPALAATPTPEQLQKQIEELQAQVEALAKQQEQDATKPKSVLERTHLGGYGELHYNNTDAGKRVDFHRFVLYVGHDFTESARFVSELELEHAFLEATGVEAADTDADGQIDTVEVERTPGEVELEQAYVELDVLSRQKLRAGLFLVPAGILNETHEPPTFYGVERNPVENAIIPTTWREAGVALGGPLGDAGLSYNLAAHSGLSIGDNYLIRGGRQNAAEASAEDLAYTARLRFTGLPGVTLSATGQYQADARQGQDADTVSATLGEAHAILGLGPLELRALYAGWQLDGAGAEAAGRQRQDGYYGEASWKILPSIGVFGRYNVWDNGGGGAESRQSNAGVNYWPMPDIVFKADVQSQDGAVDTDGFNLGVGYQF